MPLLHTRSQLNDCALKLRLHQCDYKILTHGINFCGDKIFLFKLTLVETKFFTEQIFPEYPCSTSENFKLSPQNSMLISEKFTLMETTGIIDAEWAVEVIIWLYVLFLNGEIFFLRKSFLKVLSWTRMSSSSSDDEYFARVAFASSKSKRRHKKLITDFLKKRDEE